MAGDIFYPTFLLRLVLPVDVAMTWGFIIHLVLAGLFTFAFLRAWRLGFWPSLIGGLAYMMGGPIASYVSPGHDGKLFVSALLPLALLLAMRGVREGRRWAWGALALVVGLGVLSPHPQLLQYMLLCTGAFALFVAFVDTGVRVERGTAIRRLGLFTASVLAGFAMGAIQFLPVYEYVNWSPRGEGGMSRGWEHATSYSFPPEELLNTILPQFSGILDAYWGRNGIHLHSEYLGVAVLVLAGLAFGSATDRASRNFLRFWIATAVVGLLWSLGGFTPFYRLVYAVVPGTRFFRAPSTFVFIVALAIAVFAALGTRRLLERGVARGYLIGWLVVGALLLALGVGGGLTSFATTVAAEARYDAVLANQQAVAAGAVRSFVVVIVALAALLLIARGRLRAPAAGVVLAAMIALDLWSIERLYWRFSPRAERLYASDPTIEHIKAQREPARVLALPFQDPEAFHDPFFQGDALMVHDVRQVLGYHGNELARYQRLVGKDEGYRPILTPAIWRLLNVRYLLTNVDTSMVPGLPLLVGPVRNAAGSTAYLYQLPGENPFAWVAPVGVKAEDDVVLATLRDGRFDPARAALVAPDSPVPAARNVTSLPEPAAARVRVERYAPGEVALRIEGEVAAGSVLIVSENYYPGWRARVDGREAPIGRADLSLIGVGLSAGARTVSLTFRSAPFETGKWITLAAIAAAVVWALAGLAMERRGRE
jgi:hypothetical protein